MWLWQNCAQDNFQPCELRSWICRGFVLLWIAGSRNGFLTNHEPWWSADEVDVENGIAGAYSARCLPLSFSHHSFHFPPWSRCTWSVNIFVSHVYICIYIYTLVCHASLRGSKSCWSRRTLLLNEHYTLANSWKAVTCGCPASDLLGPHAVLSHFEFSSHVYRSPSPHVLGSTGYGTCPVHLNYIE